AGQRRDAQRHSDSEVTPRPLALPPIAAIKRAPPVVWFMAGICTTLVGVIVILLMREPPTTYATPVAEQASATQVGVSAGVAAETERGASNDDGSNAPTKAVDTDKSGKTDTAITTAEKEEKSASVDEPQQDATSEAETAGTVEETAKPSAASATKV